VGPEGPEDERVEDVAGDGPGEDEDAEGDVTGCAVAEVVEQFSELYGLAPLSSV
jgi:hypothetical protein